MSEEFSLKRLLDIRPEIKPKGNSSGTLYFEGEHRAFSLLRKQSYQIVNFHVVEKNETIKTGKKSELIVPRVTIILELSDFSSPNNIFAPIDRFKETHELSRKVDFLDKMTKLLKKPNISATEEKAAISKVITDSVNNLKDLIVNFK